MQFPAEFEWLSPSGQGVLTHYMPNHYSAGWWMDSSVSLAEAEEKVYELYLALKPAASTKNLLLPVGTDYTPAQQVGHGDPSRLAESLRLAAIRLRQPARLLRRCAGRAGRARCRAAARSRGT